MSTLQAFTCRICGGSFLVGINGRDIAGTGNAEGNNMLAVGNDEIKNSPVLNKATALHCGKYWPIEDMKEVEGVCKICGGFLQYEGPIYICRDCRHIVRG